jgi:hypothetical protein
MNGMVRGQVILDAMNAAVKVARKADPSALTSGDRHNINELELSARNGYVANPSGGSGLQVVPTLSYGDSNRVKQSARDTITKAIAAASSSLGIAAVKKQARKELPGEAATDLIAMLKKYAPYIIAALLAPTIVSAVLTRVARGK